MPRACNGVMRMRCVKLRACKGGPRGADGKCPKYARGPRRGPTFVERNYGATKMQALARGFLQRMRNRRAPRRTAALAIGEPRRSARRRIE